MTSLTIVRRIAARPQVVFAALTAPEGIACWWGPDGGPALLAETDVRAGGRLRVRFRMLDGTEHESSGQYLEIVPPTRLAMTWAWHGGKEDPGESRIEIELRAIGTGTEITFTHSLLADAATSASHEAGWNGALDKLAQHFERLRNGGSLDPGQAVSCTSIGRPDNMMVLTTFAWVPSFARGLVRDLRVRWALEEAGIPYQQRFIDHTEKHGGDYRALQPFGQVPAIETGNLKLFESGAIVLYIAEQSEILMPRDEVGRARTIAWMIAALNSVEPPVQTLAGLDHFHAGHAWANEQRPVAQASVRSRLDAVEKWLGERDYLEDRFTAGDLLMTTVLRILRDTEHVAERPKLLAYQERCEARPAFVRALADHMKPFEAAAA